MALTKDQMARRAVAEFEPREEATENGGRLTLVTSFGHFELDLVARRNRGSSVVVAGTLQVSEAGELGTPARSGPEIAALDRDGRDRDHSHHRLVVLMEHCDKDGAPRIVRTCGLAVAGRSLVSRVLTELAAIDVGPDGLILREVAPGVSARDVQDHTEPTLKIGPDLKEMRPV
jgi:acyl CoA:acetate/3-ketoacid CoA transferase beta subunit